MRATLLLALALAAPAAAGELTIERRYPTGPPIPEIENPLVLEENGRELGELERDGGGHLRLDRDADDLDWDDLEDADDDGDDE